MRICLLFLAKKLYKFTFFLEELRYKNMDFTELLFGLSFSSLDDARKAYKHKKITDKQLAIVFTKKATKEQLREHSAMPNMDKFNYIRGLTQNEMDADFKKHLAK